MRARDFLFRAILAMPIAGASLLCAELAVRLLARPPAQLIAHDPVLGWRNLARARITYPDGDLTTNAQGFRGPDHRERPAEGRARILLLGDSYTAGMHFPDASIFPYLLAEKTGAVVLTAAAPAWATDQQLRFFETEGAQLGAGLVLLVTAPNDLREAYARVSAPVGDSHLRAQDRLTLWLLNHSSVAQWIGGRLGFLDAFTILRRYYRFSFPLANREATDHDLFLRDEAAETRAARLHFEALLLRLRDRCREAGARLAVTVVPTLLEQSFPLISSKQHQPGIVSERVRAFAASNGIEFLDLARPVLAMAGDSRRLYMEKDFHLSQAGHAYVADQLAAGLLPMLRAPDPPRK